MGKKLKEKFYFLVASYFVFWAKMVLRRWAPQIVVVTGSSGKTTVFYLLKAQLEGVAEFAERANSAFGIPFNILGLERKTLTLEEWWGLFWKAPLKIFQKETRKKIYVVEADVDRPLEGRFTARLLNPDYVLLLNIQHTHAEHFDELVRKGKYVRVQEAINDEFLNFVRFCKKRVLINGDSQEMSQVIDQANLAEQIKEKIEYLQEGDYFHDYELGKQSTTFVINKQRIELPYLLPRVVALGIMMTQEVMGFLGRRVDDSWRRLQMPVGRSTLLKGIKNTWLIDSSYNANAGSMGVMLQLFEDYPGEHKWLVLGQMLEQGEESKKEHEYLAEMVLGMTGVERMVVIGEINERWLMPYLSRHGLTEVKFFGEPLMALTYLKEQLQGGEVLLLKGAPFMEAMVEGLLADPADARLLVRREEVYQKRREKFYGKKSS